jgi:hypothetical protein
MSRNLTQHVCLNRLAAVVLMRTIPALSLAFWTAVTAAKAQSFSGAVLTVRVYNHAGVPDKIVWDAQQVAGKILRKAGIGTIWIACLKEEADRYRACRTAPGVADVILLIVSRPMEVPGAGPEAGGLALPLGDDSSVGRAYAFYPRVEEAVRRYGRMGPATLLGHVIAHEIGHLLLGPAAHAPLGIMRLWWWPEDLQRIATGKLLFFPDQARAMQAELSRRAEHEMASRRVRPPD